MDDAPGMDAAPGTDGPPGIDDAPGIVGAPGIDDVPGIVGAPGIEGTPDIDGIAIGAPIPGDATADGAIPPESCANAHNGQSTSVSTPANERRDFIANSPLCCALKLPGTFQ